MSNTCNGTTRQGRPCTQPVATAGNNCGRCIPPESTDGSNRADAVDESTPDFKHVGEKIVVTVGDNDYSIDPEGEVAEHLDPHIEVDHATNRMTVRYANIDPFASDPLEDAEERHLLTLVESQADADKLSDRLMECSQCGYHQDDHIGGAEECQDGGGTYEPSDLVKKLKDGRAFWVEKYDHSQVVYALGGESSALDRRWDVTPRAGVIEVPDDVSEEHREGWARGTLDTYTSWANGDSYGVTETVVDLDSGEEVDTWSVWGYIGSDTAEEVIQGGL